MQYLDWMAEHWLLTILLAWFVTAGLSSFFGLIAAAIVGLSKGSK